MDEVKPRSDKMRKCLQKYCSNLAETLNDAGLDMKTVLKEEVEIPWNEDMAKEFLWRPIQKIMTGFDSTTKPSDLMYTQIFAVLDRQLAAKLGVSVSWPSIDSQQEEYNAKSHRGGESQKQDEG